MYYDGQAFLTNLNQRPSGRKKNGSVWKTEAPQVLFKWVTIKVSGFLEDSHSFTSKKKIRAKPLSLKYFNKMFQRFLQATLRLFTAYKRRIWNLKRDSIDMLLYSLGGSQWLHLKTALLTCTICLQVAYHPIKIIYFKQSIVVNSVELQLYRLYSKLKNVFFLNLLGQSMFWRPPSHTGMNDFFFGFSIVYLISSFIRYSNAISITPMLKLH